MIRLCDETFQGWLVVLPFLLFKNFHFQSIGYIVDGYDATQKKNYANLELTNGKKYFSNLNIV